MAKSGLTRALICLSVLWLASVSQAAEPYPTKPIKMVVSYAPGGTLDVPARIVAQQLSLQMGHQILVENRPGAGGNIGAEYVKNQPADGYTLLVSGSNLPIAPSLFKNVAFDPNASFVHVARLVVMPSALVVRAESPYKSLSDFTTAARARAGALTYASPGAGSPSQLAMELFKRTAAVDVRHIPYKGAAPALNDLLGGQVDAMIGGVSGMVQHIRNGRLRALAVTTIERHADLGGVPAIAETYPGFELVTWIGVAGPAKLPAATVDFLAEHIQRALHDTQVENRLKQAGMTPSFLGPAAISARVKEETSLYQTIIRSSGLTAD
jgi:tripartite-type tricarboxylate transporter receptor subunit TctC